MQFTDQINTILELQNTPKRIICLVPSITELLVDLGLESSIIGVTKFCVHPEYLRKKKTIVGGTKNIKVDKIKDLHPDFIICNKEENTKEIVAFCGTIAITYVSDIYTIEDTLALIHQFGDIFSCNRSAQEIIESIKNKRSALLKFAQTVTTKNVAYFIWKDPWMVAAKHTFINHLLKLNNFNNVFEKLERYPEIDPDKLNNNENLDCILLSSEPYPFKQEHIHYLKQKTPNTEVILVNGEYFSWYGSRLLKAFDYFEDLHLNI